MLLQVWRAPEKLLQHHKLTHAPTVPAGGWRAAVAAAAAARPDSADPDPAAAVQPEPITADQPEPITATAVPGEILNWHHSFLTCAWKVSENVLLSDQCDQCDLSSCHPQDLVPLATLVPAHPSRSKCFIDISTRWQRPKLITVDLEDYFCSCSQACSHRCRSRMPCQ